MTAAELKKHIRDGTQPARRVYVAARRASSLVRDWGRYRAVRGLPDGPLSIRPDAAFLVVPPGSFSLIPDVVASARGALARFDTNSPEGGRKGKRFLVNVLPDTAHSLDSPIVRFALQPDVLGVVSRYLGLVPILTAVRVFHSDTTEGVPTSSQLFHVDADDITQVKIFVYCGDVDERSGPLTIVDAAATGRLQKRLKFRAGGRLSDGDVLGSGDGVAHPIVGPAGTIVFVDTSRCLHFGSRVAPDAPARLVVMLQYSTPYSFMVPGRYQDAAPLRHLIASSSTPLQRLVLGA